MKSLLEQNLTAHARLFEAMLSEGELKEQIFGAAKDILHALQSGGKVILLGNGGSASEAEHIAAEFVGSFCEKTKPLSAIALTANTAVLTALANDFGYEQVFGRQLEALATAADIVIGLSTSGKSENVRCALKKANELGAHTLALCGADGKRMPADTVIEIPSRDTACIQQAHLFIGHYWAQCAKEYLK